MKLIHNLIFEENSFLYIIYLCVSILLFVNLTKFPIFIDETTYLEISKNILIPKYLIQTAKLGILPGLPALLFIIQKIFVSSLNLLLASRALIALTGFLSSILIYKITFVLTNKKTAILAGIIFLSIPYNFLHSRLILLEPPMTFYFLISLYLYILFLKTYLTANNGLLKYNYLIVSLFFLILSFLTKPLMVILLPIFISSPLLFLSTKKKVLPKFKKLLKLTLLGLLLFMLISMPFILVTINHYYKNYGLNNLVLLFSHTKVNLFRSTIWIKSYVGSLLLAALLSSWVIGLVQKNKVIIWLLTSLISVIVLESLFGGKLLFPRHLYPVTIFLSISIAWLINKVSLNNNYLVVIILVIIICPSLSFNLNLVRNPQKVNYAPEDKQQYFEDWSSGVGLKEISNDLKKLSENRPINLYVGDEEFLTWALPNIYGIGNTKIEIIKNYTGGETQVDLQSLNRGENYYLLLNKEPYPPKNFHVELIYSYPKGPNRTINLYHLTEELK